MPQIFPDFSEAPDFGPIVEDTFQARIVNVDVDEANNAERTPYLAVRFELFGPKAEAAKVAKRQITRNFMLRGRGAGFLRGLLKAVGIPESEFRHSEMLLGKVVLVATKNET